MTRFQGTVNQATELGRGTLVYLDQGLSHCILDVAVRFIHDFDLEKKVREVWGHEYNVLEATGHKPGASIYVGHVGYQPFVCRAEIERFVRTGKCSHPGTILEALYQVGELGCGFFIIDTEE